jgi:hypothetical protein
MGPLLRGPSLPPRRPSNTFSPMGHGPAAFAREHQRCAISKPRETPWVYGILCSLKPHRGEIKGRATVKSVRQVPASCPRCGGERIARLLWGDKPVVGEELPVALAGTVLLAGRELPQDVPLWACLASRVGWRSTSAPCMTGRRRSRSRKLSPGGTTRRALSAATARREHGVGSASCWPHWCQLIRGGGPSSGKMKKRGRGSDRNNGPRPLFFHCP